MRKTAWFAAGAALALAFQPAAAAAQADESKSDDVLAAMAQMFQVQPLTTEQQARLPAAQKLVETMMPPGTMEQVMGSMFDGMLGPIMKMATKPSAGEVAKELGLESGDLDLSEEQAAEAAAILDPAWTERRERQMTAMQTAMGKAMTVMEPGMRKGLAEAFAVHFTPRELSDIGAFFATESGLSFARKSYTLSSDPRIMSAAMQSLPEMMASMAAMKADLQSATADLPARRGYGDLSEEQRRTLSELTGLDQETIEQGMDAAAERRDQDEL